MTQAKANLEQRFRSIFKLFNRFMLLLWRLGLGPWLSYWPSVTGRFMVLVHKGRKTGTRRLTPVNYAIVNGDVYCIAGFGSISHWYKNIAANSAVEVWLPEGWWAGEAEDATHITDFLPVMRQVLAASGVVALLVGINPHYLSNAELAVKVATYRLVRIRRTAPRTGNEGPGDLVWVWPLTLLGLLGWCLRQRCASRD